LHANYIFSITGKKQVCIQALVLDNKDNVAVSITDLKKNSMVKVQFQDGCGTEIIVIENIPKYHKFALCDIPRNEQIIKYGYPIGRTIDSIKKGMHVHIHNTISEAEVRAYGRD